MQACTEFSKYKWNRSTYLHMSNEDSTWICIPCLKLFINWRISHQVYFVLVIPAKESPGQLLPLLRLPIFIFNNLMLTQINFVIYLYQDVFVCGTYYLLHYVIYLCLNLNISGLTLHISLYMLFVCPLLLHKKKLELYKLAIQIKGYSYAFCLTL